MADYYSILKKTISGLGKNTPEVRAAVYQKARVAIERQLRGLTPAPKESVIASQLDSLEQAIATIDAEYGDIRTETEPAPAVPEPEAAPEPAPAAEAPVEPVVEPTPVPPAVQETMAPEPAPTEPVSAPTPEPAPAPAVAEPVAAPEPTPPPAAPPQSDFAAHVQQEPVAEEPAAPMPPPAPSEALVAASAAAPQASRPTHQTTEGALDAMSEAVRSDRPSESGQPSTDLLDQKPLAGSGDVAGEKRGIGRFVIPAVIVALLGGAGYAAWLNKDAFLGAGDDRVAEVSTNTEDASSGTPSADNAAATDKEAVKIGENGEDTSAGPVDEDATAGEQTEVAVSEENTGNRIQPADEETGSEPTQETEQPVREAVDNRDAQTDTEEPATTDTQTEQPVVEPVEESGTQTEQQPAAPVGEVAYLYEEGSAGSGATRTNAGINWSIQRQQIEQGSTQEPIIIGKMEIPEKEMTVDITIKRNVDEALSASHLIEIRFDVPEGFNGQGIDEVSRFVMKPTEEARGEALVAVPVKVSDGFFLIALDNLPQAQEVNTQLLTTSGWIDVPVSYTSGKRALLTLEKGGSGEQAFREAFSDWRNR